MVAGSILPPPYKAYQGLLLPKSLLLTSSLCREFGGSSFDDDEDWEELPPRPAWMVTAPLHCTTHSPTPLTGLMVMLDSKGELKSESGVVLFKLKCIINSL